ncbi:MAG: glycosyltransferase family 39 protein [Chloroflexota bacterium]
MSTEHGTRPFALSRREVAALIGLLWLYHASRLWNLTALPMFLDESLYLWWARVFRATGDLVQPIRETTILQPLLLGLMPALDGGSPLGHLFTGRWLSVAAGSLTVVGIVLLGRTLGSAHSGLIAAWLYVLSPFALFYDRIILTDGPLTLFGVACLYLTWRVCRRGGWRNALALGLMLGFAMLTKVKGVFFILIPLTVILSMPNAWRNRPRWRELAVAFGVFALLFGAMLILGGFAVQFEFVNKAGVTTDLAAQSEQFIANVVTLWVWLTAYVPGGLLIATVALGVVGMLHLRRYAIWLLGYALATLVFYLVVSRIWYPRYLLPIMPPLWLCAASGLTAVGEWMRNWPRARRWAVGALGIVVFLLLLAPSVSFDRALVTDPLTAPLPDVERLQYVEGWPAGYGLAEVVALLKEQADASADGIYVTRFTFPGLANEGLKLWLGDTPKIYLRELGFRNVPAQLNPLSQEKPTFLVLELSRYTLDDLGPRVARAQKVLEFTRPGGQSMWVVYRW